jgi:hypothetical protein
LARRLFFSPGDIPTPSDFDTASDLQDTAEEDIEMEESSDRDGDA